MSRNGLLIRPADRGSRLTYGDAALAAFVLAAASGVLLAVPYDVTHAYQSVALILLANPAAAWFRNVHYWAAQAFLVLTAIHAWDHVQHSGERRLSSGPWLRAVFAVPLTAFLMLSGFILKGDADSLQALRIVSATIAQVPLAGPVLADVVFGRGEGLLLVYVHHAATATLLTWLIVVEHGRALWPRAAALAVVAGPIGGASLWCSPALHDGANPIVKGPWYFVGLQEAFHWASHPLVVVGALLAFLAALAALRWLDGTGTRRVRRVLVAALMAYAGLTTTGWWFRGENWAWSAAWRVQPAPVVAGFVFRTLAVRADDLRRSPIPVVRGRPEGCLFCHTSVRGLSKSHDPASIGCASCHLGNAFSLDAAVAHAGVILVPGTLDNAARACGAADCHASIVPRVERSLMTTLAGIVSVDRVVWNDQVAAARPPRVVDLGYSVADSHLRQLCASCHLDAPKAMPGPVTEQSRGGGCTACHVTYGPEALDELAAFRHDRDRGAAVVHPRVHPDVALAATNAPCFGCHGRSGRISLAYEGWHEADPLPAAGIAPARVLEDGRTVIQVGADAHWARRMLCIDCHTAREVMGDGTVHARKTEALRVICEDCHPREPVRTVLPGGSDEETKRILSVREPAPARGRPLLATAAGDALVNAFLDAAGRPRLWRKQDGALLDLRPPRPICVDGTSHARLSCVSCHTAWAPRCVTCHTRYDVNGTGYDLLADRPVQGEWIEQGAEFRADPPTLGIRAVAGNGRRAEVVDPFIPGMIATLDRNRAAGGRPDLIFRRLYARAFSHTVTRAGRSCRSCHNDPIALGYGQGRLEYVRGPGSGRWTFTPAHAPSPFDGLPADAWIPFMAPRTGPVSTRDDVRPFNVEEQRRILEVGACLECHEDDSGVMKASLIDYQAIRRRVSPRCLLPAWQ